MDNKNKIIVNKDFRPGIYKHYKGNEYKLLCVATHSETMEEMVVYQALYGGMGVWVRPAAMWAEQIMIDGDQVPRFAFVREA